MPTLFDFSRIEQPEGFLVAAIGLFSIQHEWLRLPDMAWEENAAHLRGALVAATDALAAFLRATADEARPGRARLALARGIVTAHVAHVHAETVRDVVKAADRERERLQHLGQRDRADARVLDDAAHVLRRRAIERAAEDDPRRVERAQALEAIAQGIRAQADEHAYLIAELDALTDPPVGGRPKRPRDLLRDAVFAALPRLAEAAPGDTVDFFRALARALLGESEDDLASDAASLMAAQLRHHRRGEP